MTISVIVHGEEVQDDEDEFISEAGDVMQKDFTTTGLVKRLTKLLKQLEKLSLPEFTVFTEDNFVSLIDHGGELDHDDVLVLAEEIGVVEEAFPDIEFANDDEHTALELFMDELQEVIGACQESEGHLEIFNFEETADSEEEIEADTEADAAVDDDEDEDDEEDDDDDFDDDLGGDDDVRNEAESFISKILGGAFEGFDVGDDGAEPPLVKED